MDKVALLDGKTWVIRLEEGREIRFAASRVGRDCLISVTGGAAHIGAVAVASPDGETWLHQCAHHREGELARHIAEELAPRAACTICVVAGIHFDHLTQAGIAKVLSAVRDGLRSICTFLHDAPYRKE